MILYNPWYIAVFYFNLLVVSARVADALSGAAVSSGPPGQRPAAPPTAPPCGITGHVTAGAPVLHVVLLEQGSEWRTGRTCRVMWGPGVSKFDLS